MDLTDPYPLLSFYEVKLKIISVQKSIANAIMKLQVDYRAFSPEETVGHEEGGNSWVLHQELA